MISSVIFVLVTVMICWVVGSQIDEEVWISVENRIEAFSEAKNYSLEVPSVKHFIGLSNPLYNGDQMSAIFATELGVRGPSLYKLDKNSQTLLSTPMGSQMPLFFEDVVVDDKANTLFLTSGNSHSIFSMKAEENTEPTVFLLTGNKKPTGISIDNCSKFLFWSNSNRKSPSIEVLNPATGDSWTLINSNLTRPRSIYVDTPTRQVYWTDTNRGTFWISRSNLDGSHREVVCQARNHEAFSMVVTEEYIYWSDWTSHALWRTKKLGDCNFELIKKFSTAKPHGVSFIEAPKYSCHDYSTISKPATFISQKYTEKTTEEPRTTTEELRRTTEEPRTTTEKEKDLKDEICRDHCLNNGECSVEDLQPTCQCTEGFFGVRCEIDKCHNFCLGNGTCVIVEGEPECICEDGLHGERCQIQTLVQTETKDESDDTRGDPWLWVYILGTITGLLSLVVAVLSVKVHKMRLRPRVVRKRFISVPGTARKEAEIVKSNRSCGLPVQDGIQLDIENCCDMTLCDTPCFEPPTRGPKKTKKSKSCKETQDKKSLLDNDDEDF